MPIRDLVVALALAAGGLTACAINPDPRTRPIDTAVRDGRGGWIVVTLASGVELEGELISVDSDAVRVLTTLGLVPVAPSEVAAARLWAWDPIIGGTIVWGGLGTASTVSHGFFLIFSAPVWVLTTTLVASIESRQPRLAYPDHSWSEVSRWARFPQGMPAGLHGNDLIHQDRAPVGTQPAQHGPPGAPVPAPGAGSGEAGGAAGSGAGSDAGAGAGAGSGSGAP